MNKLVKIIHFGRRVEAARRHYSGGLVSTYARALRLLRQEFSPKEIFLWGLLDPVLDVRELERFVSKERFLRFQGRLSPPSHACLLEDKEVFYRYCEAIELPIPETIAFLSRGAAWFSGGKLGGPGATLQDRIDALHDGSELIIKPCDGVYGAGVRALVVESGSLVEDGRRCTPKELMEELTPGDRYILQRRLLNHSAIADLTGMKTLQALRVVTALPATPGERGRVVSASLRLSANEDVAGNFDYGRGGNIRAKIEVESGRICRAVRASPTGFGMDEVATTSATKHSLIEFELPFWAEMKELLEVKSACFYPVRLVGWDVAITPVGPVVIEGNFWFDPNDNAYGEVRQFMESVAPEY